MVLDGKSSHEYPVSAEVPEESFLGTTLFLLYINDLPGGVICGIGIYADDTTLFSQCDQASDLWRQLELASELRSDLWGTVNVSLPVFYVLMFCVMLFYVLVFHVLLFSCSFSYNSMYL